MIEARIFPQSLFIAGFTTRGESLGKMESLALFMGRIFSVRQVHSKEIAVVLGNEIPEAFANRKADALITGAGGLLLTVWTADCVPVLLGSRDGKTAAAVHAGWRGLAAGIIPATVAAALELFGTAPSSLIASIGPAIGPCCYEVGEDVLRKLVDSCGEEGAVAVGSSTGTIRVDLQKIASLQLRRCGLDPAAIETIPICTKCSPATFYSYRRGDVKGRQCGLIGIR